MGLEELGEGVGQAACEEAARGLGVTHALPGALDLDGADGAAIFGAVGGDDVGAAVEGGARGGMGADGAGEAALAAGFEEGAEAERAADDVGERAAGA